MDWKKVFSTIGWSILIMILVGLIGIVLGLPDDNTIELTIVIIVLFVVIRCLPKKKVRDSSR